MDLRFVLTEAVKGLRRHFAMAAAVMVCVAVSLTLLGAAWLLSRQVDDLKGYWYDKVEVSVFLCGTASEAAVCPDGEVTDQQRDNIRGQLEALPVTEQVFYESKDQAWARFSETYAGSRVMTQVDSSTMPESFRVKLTDPTQVAQVADAVAAVHGVDSVQDQRKLLAQFFSVVSGLQLAGVSVAVAQALVALLLISTMVRSAVTARRREIFVMRLLGASRGMVRGPFLAEAALAGLAGSLVAVGVLVALRGWVINAALQPKPGTPLRIAAADMWVVCPALVGIGVLATVVAVAVSLRRHLRT